LAIFSSVSPVESDMRCKWSRPISQLSDATREKATATVAPAEAGAAIGLRNAAE